MNLGRQKILVVDDEESARKLIIASLRKADYQILQAEGGREAIRIANREHPDLIIMDICLAETNLDGYQTAEIITEECPGQTILFVSGKIDYNNRRAAIKERWSFLNKPFSPLDLRARVKRILERPPAKRARSL
ncbi:response regulator [Acanthopleuribacter pedis]|uniref:Response regulator n=1 Tax=Acanthopleuribacter pedis TaxID=442870 RepID=A0A8J7Q4V9_9BACT|nr:response regulator [Acanthopleuribacter pedis]MBO1317896.1 response regulator [Acanthopleuribacter pedis]